MDFLKTAKGLEQELIAMRRHLHENPEVSGKEDNTIAYIKGKLDEYGVKYVDVKHGGLICSIGDETKGKTVLLRADVDALPMPEDPNNLKGPKVAVSKVADACHACGHDGHTSMMLITAKMLKAVEADLKGRVIIVFERGEEIGAWCRYLFRYLDEKKTKIDVCYGTHVQNAIPAGKISAEPGGVMAAAIAFAFKIVGKSGHGSRPDLANNPIDCFVAVYNAINAMRMRYISPFETLTFSVGALHAGAQGNIIPDDLAFTGTVRFFDADSGWKYYNELKNILDNVTKAYNCTYEIERFTEPSVAVLNNPEVSAFVKNVIKTKLGEQHSINAEPWMASESFALYLQAWPGVLCFLGINNPEQGIGAEHHNKHFDLDESVLHVGSAASAQFAYEFLLNPPALNFKAKDASLMDMLKRYKYDVFLED